jgi:hypothetical protein
LPRRRISSARRSKSLRNKINSALNNEMYNKFHCSPLKGRERVINPMTGRCRLVTVHDRSRRRSSRNARRSRNRGSFDGYRRSIAHKYIRNKPCTTLDGRFRIRNQISGRCRLVKTVAASDRRKSRNRSRNSRYRRHAKSSSRKRSDARKYYRAAMAKKGFLVKSRVRARKV